jgi:hypothetical protein
MIIGAMIIYRIVASVYVLASATTGDRHMTRTILITGTSSGWQGNRRTLSGAGLACHRDDAPPEAAAFDGDTRQLRVLPLDVTNAASIASLIEAAGQIDVLVNNAGIGAVGAFEATPMALVRQLFDTNTIGVMAMCQAVIPQMRARRAGTIVNVTSSVTLGAFPLAAAYTASKQAIEGSPGRWRMNWLTSTSARNWWNLAMRPPRGCVQRRHAGRSADSGRLCRLRKADHGGLRHSCPDNQGKRCRRRRVARRA